MRFLVPFFSLLIAIASPPASAAEKKAAGGPAQRLPTVTALDHSILAEERPVDETGRPEWTGARRFPGTRVYIQKAPWEAGIESWWRLKHKRDGKIAHRLLQEVEIGLPHRMQLDLSWLHWSARRYFPTHGSR